MQRSNRKQSPRIYPIAESQSQLQKERSLNVICLRAIGECRDSRCPYIHRKLPYQWQRVCDGDCDGVCDGDSHGDWIDCFPVDACYYSEEEYCCPEPFGPATCAGAICFEFKIHFQPYNSYSWIETRRLSTPSSVEHPTEPRATRWVWYKKNCDEYCERQYSEMFGGKYCSSECFSPLFRSKSGNEAIERAFLAGETSFEYNDASNTRNTVDLTNFILIQGGIKFIVIRRPSPQISTTEDFQALTTLSACGIEDSPWRIDIPRLSWEYTRVTLLLGDNLDHLGRPPVVGIQRVQNQKQLDAYEAKRGALTKNGWHKVNEMTLFHGTSQKSVDGICRYNLDFAQSGSKYGSKFGRGAYFATTVSGALQYSRGTTKCVIVAKVLIGEPCVGSVDYDQPPVRGHNFAGAAERFDSCVDSLTKPTQFVIFDKSQIHPQYVVFFRSSAVDDQ